MAIRYASITGGTLKGTDSDDLLWGRGGNDRIVGLGGDDMCYGGYGTDYLLGGAGSDHLRGAAGSDTLRGGSGADVLQGGADTDYFVFRPVDGTNIDTISDFQLGTDQLVLGGALTVDPDASFRADVNFDGETDTVLALSNSASIVLLSVGGVQDWSMTGPNVTHLSELDLLT